MRRLDKVDPSHTRSRCRRGVINSCSCWNTRRGSSRTGGRRRRVRADRGALLRPSATMPTPASPATKRTSATTTRWIDFPRSAPARQLSTLAQPERTVWHVSTRDLADYAWCTSTIVDNRHAVNLAQPAQSCRSFLPRSLPPLPRFGGRRHRAGWRRPTQSHSPSLLLTARHCERLRLSASSGGGRATTEMRRGRGEGEAGCSLRRSNCSLCVAAKQVSSAVAQVQWIEGTSSGQPCPGASSSSMRPRAARGSCAFRRQRQSHLPRFVSPGCFPSRSSQLGLTISPPWITDVSTSAESAA